jgi:leucyl/phenylalanyl-tRNA--protein transferase
MLTPQIVLDAYSKGLFPMAENRRDKQLFWIDPEVRGILPLDNFHIPRSLKKKIRNNPFEVRFDHNFAAVIRACAQQKPKRRDTWINDEIIELYTKLFCMRHAHSVECWQEEKLVGGLYGISIGGAFFGESMFSSERDSSKIALVHLVARLKLAGFTLLDTQFITDHLKQFGAIEISRVEYHKILNVALNLNVGFHLEVSLDSEEGVLRRILQSKTQTS